MTTIDLRHGDCLEVMRQMIEDGVRVDSVVTDAPYHLASIVKRFGKKGSAPAKHGTDGAFARASKGFMGQSWDGGDIAFQPETWHLCWELLKPGGYILVFGATRNYHRVAYAVEDAGFEIRDSILEMIASDAFVRQFMESLNESQIDAFMRCIEESQFGGLIAWAFGTGFPKSHDVSKGIDKMLGVDSDEGQNWRGFGSSLKPAYEPIVMGRKPLEGTIATNVLEYGVGAINIDGCRIEGRERTNYGLQSATRTHGNTYGKPTESADFDATKGRFPANVILDGSEEVLESFAVYGDKSSPWVGNKKGVGAKGGKMFGGSDQKVTDKPEYADQGTAARFFYSAKASKHDRAGSNHPTVKPISLMRYLCRLVTPPGGVVLDPFAGSGTTGEAAYLEGFNSILIEREDEYVADIRRRIERCVPRQPDSLFEAA